MPIIVFVSRSRLVSIVVAICLLAGLCAGSLLRHSRDCTEAASRIADAVSGRCVVIDAGHGGIDPGAVGKSGAKEADIVLSVARRLQSLLNRAGVVTIMTREDDRDLAGEVGTNPVVRKRRDLEERVRKSAQANPDLTVSIHANSFPESMWSGAQTFYKVGCSEGMRLATAIQDSLVQNLGPNTRRAKSADLYVLKNCTPPVALVEIGFLSNPREESLLRTSEYQQRAAEAIFAGIVNYLVDRNSRLQAGDSAVADWPSLRAGQGAADQLLASPDLPPSEQVLPEKLQSQTGQGGSTYVCTAYFAGPTNFQDYLVPEQRIIPKSDGVVKTADLARAVLTELISGPGQKSILAPVLPSGTKVRGITINRGVATVDLDAGFIESYWGGSRSEELTVYSIVNSLTEIEGIDAVRLTLDGRSDVSIAGHIGLDQTFYRENRLIAGEAVGEVR